MTGLSLASIKCAGYTSPSGHCKIYTGSHHGHFAHRNRFAPFPPKKNPYSRYFLKPNGPHKVRFTLTPQKCFLNTLLLSNSLFLLFYSFSFLCTLTFTAGPSVHPNFTTQSPIAQHTGATYCLFFWGEKRALSSPPQRGNWDPPMQESTTP